MGGRSDGGLGGEGRRVGRRVPFGELWGWPRGWAAWPGAPAVQR